MSNQRLTRFSERITAVIAGLYGKPPPAKIAIQMYWVALSGFTDEEIDAGITGHLVDTTAGQYPPKPADIIRHIRGRAEVNSAIAWGRVVETLNRIGTYESVCFDDPVIHAALRDVGGWRELGLVALDQLPFVQVRFERAYRAYQEHGVGEYPPMLPGVHASNGALCGLEATPIFIGHEKKAREVYRVGVERQSKRLELGFLDVKSIKPG